MNINIAAHAPYFGLDPLQLGAADYLPEGKQAELAKVINLINEVTPSEMIILFGSYARNEWVEEKYDEEHYKYQSDFDILG